MDIHLTQDINYIPIKMNFILSAISLLVMLYFQIFLFYLLYFNMYFNFIN